MTTIRLFLADDHRTVIDSLSAILNQSKLGQYQFEVAGHTLQSADVLPLLKSLPAVDVLLMDVEMPETDGIQIVQMVKRTLPDIKIVMLSLHRSWAIANQAIEYGADGYIVKSSGSQVIMEGILSVFLGKIFIDSNIARGKPLVQFDSRELDIIRLTMEEKTLEGIAYNLRLKPEQVESFRRRIMEKMGVSNLAGLAVFAWKNNLFNKDLPLSSLPEQDQKTIEISNAIRVLVVDDHQMIAEGLTQMLTSYSTSQATFEIMGYATNGQEAIDLIEKCMPGASADHTGIDVILMDLEMPVMDGMEATSRIKRMYPGIKIIMLTMHTSRTSVKAAMDLGADAFLSKNSSQKEIVQSILSVIKGLPLSLPLPPVPPMLTSEEIKVICLIISEKTNKEIVDIINSEGAIPGTVINLQQVENIRRRIMQKMEVNNVIGLIKFAMRYQLCPVSM